MALKSFLVSTLMKETRRLACGLDRWNPKQQWKWRMVWLSVYTGLKLGKGSSSIFTIWQFYSRLWTDSVFKPGLNSTVLYPPCYASPGKLSAEQLRTPHDVYSSSGPSLPSPPSAGKQPSDALWPLLQTLGLKTRGTFWLNGSSTSRTKREPVMASSALISKYHLSPKSVCLGSDVTPSHN